MSTADYLILLVEPAWQMFGAIVLSILPAWGLSSYITSDPLTRLLVAVMGSYTLMYLLEFGAYLMSAPQWIPLSLLLLACLGSTVVPIRQEMERSDAAPFPWDGMVTWAGLALWILGMQSQIAVYGGQGWWGDWHEHYERTLFFLDQLPPGTTFLYGRWTLAARGPMFNAAAALLMSLFGREFWVYQTVTTALNTFPVVAFALLIREMSGIRQSVALLWSAVILGIAPFAVPLETQTVTKFLTLGFLLGAVHLYRLGLTREEPTLVGASLGAFAAGILAHYLALPFAVFFLVHLAYWLVRRPWAGRVVAWQAVASAGLLASWFGYLIITFGLTETLTANSTFGREPGREPPPWGEIFVGNMFMTAVPYSWRHEVAGVGGVPRIEQIDGNLPREFRPSPGELNRTTEWFADLARNPLSFPGALGWAGGLGMVIVVWRAITRYRKGLRAAGACASNRGGRTPEPGWAFWLIFFLVGIPLNVSLTRDYQVGGVVHLNLQAFVCLVVVFLLRWLREEPPALQAFLLCVFLVESGLTTGALLALEGRRLPLRLGGASDIEPFAKVNADHVYVANYAHKLREHAVFISDRLGDLAQPFALIVMVMAVGLLIGAVIWIWSARPTSGESQPTPA